MSKEKEEINFEDAMKELEEIANKLEKNDLDLDKSVEIFEEGMKLSKKCSEILENAEKRITILINDGKDNLTEESFTTDQA
ncbi:MAG: exodeoxyribonuclease VII small subunit [Clostridia bacterium]|nr:exodeoxyribonuclease VII small subunit [Clostridia bacterium]